MAREFGKTVWNALYECPKTDTIQTVRANLRKALTDTERIQTIFENMVSLKSDDDGEPLKQDNIEADLMHAAASLLDSLELVYVADSYVQLNKGQQ